ncbi:hypothetical protein BGZ99_009635 [Dissophora globulifera]|uniref:BTB domain-containing protein n=1 Tax=Dissophora globulifera TaxID=979702 RepID=A0A9P6UYM9_9FUNG|nr:hypothetical protein BGZ99_009635 [Dissophora globulifera]
MTSLTVTNHIETLLSIDCPILLIESPDNTQQQEIAALGCHTESKWKVVLMRTNEILEVRVSLNYKKPCDCEDCEGSSTYPAAYNAIYIVPHHDHTISSTVYDSAKQIQDGSVLEASIEVDRVLHKDKFLFDIVLTTRAELSRKPVEPSKLIEPPKSDTTASINQEVMRTLLKDTHSVDLCFVFSSDKSYSNVGLWAHRSILSRYEPLADLIRKSTASALRRGQVASTDSSTDDNHISDAGLHFAGEDDSSTLTNDNHEVGGDGSVLTILVEKFSLATLCVLLRFIYTGEINLSADTNQHTISMTESSLILKTIAGKTRECVRWNPLDVDSPWKFKDVTWDELLLATGFYGVTELQARCEDAVIAGLDATNAVEVLFSVGCHFEKVKNAAMDFIVEKMASMVLGDKEPFASYKDHPNAYDFLMDLMRRRVAKEPTTTEAAVVD